MQSATLCGYITITGSYNLNMSRVAEHKDPACSSHTGTRTGSFWSRHSVIRSRLAATLSLLAPAVVFVIPTSLDRSIMLLSPCFGTSRIPRSLKIINVGVKYIMLYVELFARKIGLLLDVPHPFRAPAVLRYPRVLWVIFLGVLFAHVPAGRVTGIHTCVRWVRETNVSFTAPRS